MKIVTLCGSIRKNSSNHSLLKAAEYFLKGHEWINIDLLNLPYFDPDNQYGERTPLSVLKIRSVIAKSDLLIISTPEYAHGIPGILKNGLEWIFCAEIQKLPAAIIIGSAQGEWVRDQLIEVLTTMNFSISMDRCLIIHGARTKINENAIFLDKNIQSLFEDFCHALQIEQT